MHTIPNNPEEEINNNPEKDTIKVKIERPSGLSMICVLTFIGSGISALSSLMVFTGFDLIPSVPMDASLFPEAQDVKDMVMSAGRWFFLIMAVLFIISFTGATMMWKLKKIGFHCYTFSQMLMFLIPLLMIQGYIVPISSVLITSAFIGMYGLNLRFMK